MKPHNIIPANITHHTVYLKVCFVWLELLCVCNERVCEGLSVHCQFHFFSCVMFTGHIPMPRNVSDMDCFHQRWK